ncbi:transcription factor MYB1R1-like [Bidens hawaiensis]|uniref:transcription factor MYB1R1-like n=1 Tax=Bidens hawaiensis TaxID=980011 RepID=UPI00404B9CD5
MSQQLDSSSIGADEIKLFGMRMRKNHVSVPVAVADAGNISTDATARSKSSLRKPAIPWTEDEHKLFLEGLQKAGNGHWKTRTCTQVASHAQKYFLRQSNHNPRRRSSMFDITTDSVAAMQTEEGIDDDQVIPAANPSSVSSEPQGSSSYQISGSNNEDGMNS